VRRLSGLRPRITLLVTGVVVICLIVAFGTVYRRTQAGLAEQTDRELRAELDDLRTAVAPDGSAPQLARRARAYIGSQPLGATTRIFFVVLSGDKLISNQPELLDPTAVEPDETPAVQRSEARAALALRRAPTGLSDRTATDLGAVRVLVAQEPGAGGSVRLGVAEPTAPNDRAQESLVAAFLLAGGLGLIAALAGGLLVASRVSAPLQRMARIAARVDGGDLSPRMELGGRRDEVRALARSFDQMLERLQEAFNRQTTFIADASHELRTPLTVVRGQLELLAAERYPDPEEIGRVEALVRTEVDRMARLVDDLLLLAAAGEEGFLRPEPIDLDEYLQAIVESLRATADRRLELDAPPPLVIDADPDRLAQALRNLLRNAIEHTRPGGLIRLSLEEGHDRVTMLVDDDGPGIPAALRPAVFDRLWRLDPARARDRGGAGLGLAIVRAIAEAHGGGAWAGASPYGGARVAIELPTARSGSWESS
jgi:two-component system OmpR family sensor kinase